MLRRKELSEARRERDLALDKEVAQLDDDLRGSTLNEAERAVMMQRLQEIENTSPRLKLEKIARSRGRTLGGKTFSTKPQHQQGFAAETAERTGVSKQTINKHLHRAEHIAPDVFEAIRDTSIANFGVELDALSDLDHAQQMQAVRRVKAGEVANIREAIHGPSAKATRKPNSDDASGLEAMAQRNIERGLHLAEPAAGLHVTTDPIGKLSVESVRMYGQKAALKSTSNNPEPLPNLYDALVAHFHACADQDGKLKRSYKPPRRERLTPEELAAEICTGAIGVIGPLVIGLDKIVQKVTGLDCSADDTGAQVMRCLKTIEAMVAP